MTTELSSFEHFMKRRLSAAAAYVVGDPAPLTAICAELDPATFFAPLGGSVQRAENVTPRYVADDAAFDHGSTTYFEVFHLNASGDLAYWTGLQHGQVKFKGREAVRMSLRVTEIFRRDGGEWKLIHRHADPLVEAKSPPG